MRSNPYSAGEKPGMLRRGLQWHAARRDPSLQPAQPKMPLWARRPIMWLGKKALKGLFKLVSLPFVGMHPKRKKLLPFASTFWLGVTSAVMSQVHNGWHTELAVAAIAAPILWRQLGLPFGRFTRVTKTPTVMQIRRFAAFVTGAALAVTTAVIPHLLLVSPGLYLSWAPLAAWATGFWGAKPVTEEQPEAQEAVPAIDARLSTWTERIGDELGGATLTDLREMPGIDGGWTATIDLSNTKKTYDDIRDGTTGFIAARYKLPPTSVTIEPHESGRHDLGTLMVFETNPLQDAQLFNGLTFDPKTGKVTIGKHTDGRDAKWQFYVPGWGVCHGLIFGATGAGKSGLLNTLMVEARHSGVIATLFGDPHNGQSATDWMDNVTAFAGSVPRIVAMLRGAEQMMDERKRKAGRVKYTDANGNQRRRGGAFKPTRDNPILMVFIDEFSTVANDPIYGEEVVRIVARIGKEGRKFGVGVVLLVQVPSLEEMGNSQSLRSMVSSMNIAAFRTADAMSARMGIPMNLPIDPVNLPAWWPNGDITAGLGFLARGDAPASPMRSKWVPDSDSDDQLYGWATTGDPASIPENLLPVGGPFFASWQQVIDMDDDDIVAVGPDGSFIRIEDLAGGVAPIVGGARAANSAAAPAQQTSTAWDLIEAALRGHPHGMTTATLRDHTELKQQTVRTTLTRRRDNQGDVHELPGGVWKLGALAGVAA